ncbi:MAG TPA: cell division protein SepF [Bacillales bacterium]|nr:cell division protein SepF [Bacillales bacterium]
MGLITKFKQYFHLEEDPYLQEDGEQNTQEQPFVRNRKQNVVSLQSVQQNSKVILREPQSYAEVQQIADELKNHRAVVMNFQRISRYEATRMIDFLSGATYAAGGDIQKLGPHTFLCTPDNIDISGAISEMLDDVEER